MRYVAYTVARCPELICESNLLRELVRSIEYCFDDEEHGMVRLIVRRINEDGSFDSRANPARVSYDHGSWSIGGAGIVPSTLRHIVDQL